MKVGIPKEIKNNENRVGMTPAGVAELTRRGHEVSVQHTAGEGSGFSDDEYVKAGARILPTIEAVYRECDMIVKVKEPIEPEYELVRKGQLLFTYFHFACEKELTEAMLKSGAVCLAYETVQLPNGSLPLLQPMSEVAGRMATLNGAYYLQKTKGGKGKLISGVPGVSPAKVLVLGGGVVGEAAARMAAGLGAEVTIADISLPRLRQLDIETPPNVHTLYSSEHNIRKQLPTVDIIVGSVLVPGDKTPHLPDHKRDAPTDGAGNGARRRGYRSGRMLRDLTAHDPQRARVHRGRYRTLLCGKHPRRRAQHLYPRPHQRHPTLCHRSGRQGLATGMQG